MARHKHYPLRVPKVAFGIRAQELRTMVRHAMWSRDWIAALEAWHLGARLGRGRQYALSGQVTELAVTGPHVTATVLGSRTEPYRVTLDFASLTYEGIARVKARFAAQPMLTARLLADDLAQEVLEIFAHEHLPLAPVRDTVKMFCSCPDWSKPCKHLAAVLFLLGEEITRRPFLLCVLRGLEMQEILPSLNETCAGALASGGMLECVRAHDALRPSGGACDVASDALFARLGPIPFWRGVMRCQDSFRRISARVTSVARMAACGESIDLRGEK